MTFDEFISANAPSASRGEKALAKRSWDTAMAQSASKPAPAKKQRKAKPLADASKE